MKWDRGRLDDWLAAGEGVAGTVLFASSNAEALSLRQALYNRNRSPGKRLPIAIKVRERLVWIKPLRAAEQVREISGEKVAS